MTQLPSLRLLLVSLALWLHAPLALAENLVFSLGAFYFQHEDTLTGESNGQSYNATQEQTYTFLSAQGLYQMDYWVFGLKYLTGTVDTSVKNTRSAAKSVTTENYKGIGVTLGLRGQGAIVTYSYFLNPEKVYGAKLTSDFGDSDDGKTVYYGSYAHAIDLGYGFDISGVKAGPMVSLLQFEFNKYKTENIDKRDLKPKVKDSFIMPHLALWFDF